MLFQNFNAQPEKKTKVDSKDLESINKTIEAMGKIYTLSGNVHKYTRVIGSHLKSVFSPIDQKYQLSVDQDLKVTYKEILEYADNDANVKGALDTILAKAGTIEPETGAKVSDLLVRTWYLAKNSHYSNACDVVIDNLRQNKLTGGGCLAGISGRLVQPYSHFIQAKLEELSLGEYAKFAHSGYDEQLQEALILSLSETQSSLATQSYGIASDEDLQMALALSESYNIYRKDQPSLNQDNSIHDDELANILELSKYLK